MPEVFLVCGPPCSGKSTYVDERRQPGDLVVDYDDIARRLGSPRRHNHDFKYHGRVEATIARAIAGIKAGRHERAWVIRAIPRTYERAALAEDLGAEVVVLDAPDDVLIARARARGDSSKTVAAIREWRKRAD
jgi:dephospho-CoA kinase